MIKNTCQSDNYTFIPIRNKGNKGTVILLLIVSNGINNSINIKKDEW